MVYSFFSTFFLFFYSMGKLFGENNELTQEWTDGLCPAVVRIQCREDTPDRLYIMFDGPIDTLWIESLNTGKLLFSKK